MADDMTDEMNAATKYSRSKNSPSSEGDIPIAVKALSSALLAMRLATGFAAINREIDFGPTIEEVRGALAALTKVPWPAVDMPASMEGSHHWTDGTCEDRRLRGAGYEVCGSNGDQEWHWRGPDRKWHDGYKSESAAVNAALKDLRRVAAITPGSPMREGA